MVGRPERRCSRTARLLPGAVPGARVAPGAPKPSKLLLQYSVELPLGAHRCQTVQPFKLDRVALGGVGGLRTRAPSENVQAICAPAHLIAFTLALATSWSRQPDGVCFDRGEPLVWLFPHFEFKYDLPTLEDDHVAAALLAAPAHPSVLANAVAAALLADSAHPPVLADAAAAAVLAVAALPPMLAEAAAAALFALPALPSMLADPAATALLALVAQPPVLADAAATALLAGAAPPPVLADTAAAALLAVAALPPMLADANAAALLADAALPAVRAAHLASRLEPRSLWARLGTRGLSTVTCRTRFKTAIAAARPFLGLCPSPLLWLDALDALYNFPAAGKVVRGKPGAR
eukprot:scaffold109950_cov58-Phaeocystis_antarctica.AAC.1